MDDAGGVGFGGDNTPSKMSTAPSVAPISGANTMAWFAKNTPK
jgi:hypothetical protein